VREVWSAAARLGRAIGESEEATAVRAALGGGGEDAPAYSQVLAQVFAGGGPFDAQPLILAHNLARHPQVEEVVIDPAGRAFFAATETLTNVTFAFVEWLRSRLPGYPQLKLPHIDARASRVAEEGWPDARFPWLLEMRGLRFQFLGAPPDLASHLALADGGVEVRAALEALTAAVLSSPPLAGFAEARAAASPDDEQLRALLREFRNRLRPERLDAVEPALSMRRMQYRRAQLIAVERLASAAVADYYAAFRGVDNMIEAVIVLVGQYALYDGPEEFGPCSFIAYGPAHGGDHLNVRALAEMGAWIRPNHAVALTADSQTLGGILIADAVSINIPDMNSPGIATLQGRLLADSAVLL
jgi:hypothetical protein